MVIAWRISGGRVCQSGARGNSLGGVGGSAPDFAPPRFDFFDFLDDFEGCSTPLEPLAPFH